MPDHNVTPASSFDIAFRTTRSDDGVSQDEESFDFTYEGERRTLRIHDYDTIYQVPGLYEAIVYDKLRCTSPPRLARLLVSTIEDWPVETGAMSVLDLGAGNGIMAEELRRVGVERVVGLDLLPEAEIAARRDRPEAYDGYVVADLTDLDAESIKTLSDARFTCMVTAAALGFGDIPPEAFARAFNFVSSPGWIAMTIKEDFLDADGDDSGFSRLLRAMISDGILEIQAHQRYCHRYNIDGEPLFYVAVVGRKTADIPSSLLDEVSRNGTVVMTAPSSMLMHRTR